MIGLVKLFVRAFQEERARQRETPDARREREERARRAEYILQACEDWAHDTDGCHFCKYDVCDDDGVWHHTNDCPIVCPIVDLFDEGGDPS